MNKECLFLHVFRLVITAIILLCNMAGVQAIELMTWDRLPLAVPLRVGQERVIFVERNVRVGVPGSLSGKLRVQSTGGTIYLLALEEILPTRIQLQDAETGALILIDIAATLSTQNAPSPEPIQIVEGEKRPVRYGQNTASSAINDSQSLNSRKIKVQGNATTVATEQTQQQRETPVPVILTRYAAQNLYVPLRTVEPISGISRINIRRDLDLTSLLPMQPVKAKVLAAWQLEEYVVTAVLLQNTSKQAVTLDPRLLQGDFIAATFQHPYLEAAGDSADTTVLYLITHKSGLAQSLLPQISPVNAQSHITKAADTNSGDPYEK